MPETAGTQHITSSALLSPGPILYKLLRVLQALTHIKETSKNSPLSRPALPVHPGMAAPGQAPGPWIRCAERFLMGCAHGLPHVPPEGLKGTKSPTWGWPPALLCLQPRLAPALWGNIQQQLPNGAGAK